MPWLCFSLSNVILHVHFFFILLSIKTLNPDAITSLIIHQTIKPLWYLRELLIYPPVNDMFKLYIFFKQQLCFSKLKQTQLKSDTWWWRWFKTTWGKGRTSLVQGRCAALSWRFHEPLDCWGHERAQSTLDYLKHGYEEKLQQHKNIQKQNLVSPKTSPQVSTTTAEVKCWFSMLEECVRQFGWLLARSNLPQYNCMTIKIYCMLHCPKGETPAILYFLNRSDTLDIRLIIKPSQLNTPQHTHFYQSNQLSKAGLLECKINRTFLFLCECVHQRPWSN